MSHSNDDRIFTLAKAAGLASNWIDAIGHPQQVTAESLRAILNVLDLPSDSDAQYQDSLARLAILNDENTLPPLVTGTINNPLRLPGGVSLAGKHYRVEWEEGGHIEGRFADDLFTAGELPPIEQPGYHRLFIGDRTVTLAIAPPRCFGVADALGGRGGLPANLQESARVWGLGVQLYSLRRAGDGGIGDFTSLSMLAQSAAAKGAAAVAISPVHAMFSADVRRFSPYGPSSRLFLNALHIDPAAVMGIEALHAAQAAVGADTMSRLNQLEQDRLIDWPAAGTLRLSLLRELYKQFRAQGTSTDQDAFNAFRTRHGDALRDHARFEALHAWRIAQGESGYWRDWPEGLRNPRGAEVEAFARDHQDEIGFHEFLQWQASRGLSDAQKSARDAGMPIGLIADLAVGADNGGSQAWSRQNEIFNGLSVGAPPDLLNTRGQSWGLGAFSPHAMKAQGFGAYIEMLRATFAYAGGARIDHVLGLSRLWLVPDGATATQGAYLQYPLQDLLRLIALESWRHRAIVIGEDLGTVPPGFGDQLAQAGLLGIRVLLFQQDGRRFFNPSEWSRDAIATTTTHDLPTIGGWWQGRDIDWRNELDLLEKGQTENDARHDRQNARSDLWNALTEAGCAQGDAPAQVAESAPLREVADFISKTPAPLAILPIEDALGLAEQPNLPGTVDTHPNWRRRLVPPLDTLLDEPLVASRLAVLNQSRSLQEKN